MTTRRTATRRPDGTWARIAALALALGGSLAGAVGASANGVFPSPFASCPAECPPILDDPAKIGVRSGGMCTNGFRWGFQYDSEDTLMVPDPMEIGSQIAIPYSVIIDPIANEYRLWVIIGTEPFESGCTEATCLYQSISPGSFTMTPDGKYIYRDAGAAAGAANFVSGITFGPQPAMDGMVHVTTTGFVVPPAQGDITLVLQQVGGNVISVPGAGQIELPTISFGVDRRDQPWRTTGCGWRLPHFLTAAFPPAPGLYFCPQCQVIDPLCPSRLHLAPAIVRQGPGGSDVFELHVAFTPASPLLPSAEDFAVVLGREDDPPGGALSTVYAAQLAPGDLQLSSGKYRYQGADLAVTITPRNNGQLVVDVIAHAALPPLGDQDLLQVALKLGPDTRYAPLQPTRWKYDANGNLVLKGGAGGLPFCAVD